MTTSFSPEVLMAYSPLPIDVSSERGALLQAAASILEDLGLADRNSVTVEEANERSATEQYKATLTFSDLTAAEAFAEQCDRLASQKATS
jgi:hypothetical protein